MISSEPRPMGKCMMCHTPFKIGDGHNCTEAQDFNKINTNMAIDNARRQLAPPSSLIPGKKIETVEHPDGRRDVTIKVNKLDLDETDEATKKAQDVIENDILPKLAQRPVMVVVLHVPTKASTYRVVRLSDVRKYAEFAVDQFMKTQATAEYMGNREDFVIIEQHLMCDREDVPKFDVKVSSL